MLNDSLKYALVFFVVSCFLANCASAQFVQNRERTTDESSSNVDLSTNEAVIAELQKMADAKNAARIKGDEKLEAKRKAASKLETKDVCIERLKESAKIIIIGFFRYDYGCHFEGAFINSAYFEANEAALSKSALAALGWEKAPQKERERLAKLWVEKGLLAFSTVLYTKDRDFTGSEFQPPQVVSKENGETVVTLWTSFMRRKKEYKFLEYKFSADGNLTES